MERKYTRIDDNNVAVIETQENRNILNKEVLLKQKEEITKKFDGDIAVLDEALSKFTE